jgi:hypothetical protein
LQVARDDLADRVEHEAHERFSPPWRFGRFMFDLIFVETDFILVHGDVRQITKRSP